MFFPLYTGVAPPIYVTTTSFKLMALRNIMVEEALLFRSASVTMKQTSHPVKSVIMHCEKSSVSQIGFYSVRIWTLNKLCFHRLIGEIAIREDFLLKFFHKNVFPWQLDKKRKILFHASTFCNENKMILAHRALNFFSVWR